MQSEIGKGVEGGKGKELPRVMSQGYRVGLECNRTQRDATRQLLRPEIII